MAERGMLTPTLKKKGRHTPKISSTGERYNESSIKA
jgi:hypothetical protein